MWDNSTPLQLLNSMPRKLTKENLEKLQLVIDADKYKNSLLSGFDLCGMYAPFCRECKKTSIYPCAIAYINMMKLGGMDIEIDAKPVEPSVRRDTEPEETQEAEDSVEEIAEDAREEELPEASVSESKEAIVSDPEPVAVEKVDEKKENKVKTKIRIAIARKKL